MKKWLAKKLRELLSVRSSEKRENGRIVLSLEDNEEKISNVLTLLGAQYDREDAGEGRVRYSFDFQGGRFRFFVSESNLVKIIFPYFYSVDPDALDLLRYTCNECNMQALVSKVVYSFNEKGNQYVVHIQSSLSLTNTVDTFDIYVSDVLKNIFELSRRFRDIYEAQAEKFRQGDAENFRNAGERNVFLLREQELQHIMPAYRWRVNTEVNLTIGQLFDTLFDLPSDCLAYLSMMRPAHKNTSSMSSSNLFVEGNVGVADFGITTALVEGNGKDAFFAYDWANISVLVNHPMTGGKPQLYTIMLQSAGETEGSLYVRLTLCQSPLPNDNKELGENNVTDPISYSFVVAYDKSDPTARLQEFKYMMQDALDKVDENREAELTEEQNMMLANTEHDVSYALYFGTRLYSSGRYYEALLLLESAYFASQGKFDKSNEAFRDRFFLLCYYIGFCHAELKQFQKALYYLQILVPLKSINYTMEYINCLVNAGDFRAVHVVDDLIAGVKSTMEDEESDHFLDEEMMSFYDFLRRRKVYLQVEKNELDEAEAECKKMLEEPRNNEFALTELAYIQSVRREDEMEETMEE